MPSHATTSARRPRPILVATLLAGLALFASLLAPALARAETTLSPEATARVTDDTVQGLIRRYSALPAQGGDAATVQQWYQDAETSLGRPMDSSKALEQDIVALAQKAGAVPSMRVLGSFKLDFSSLDLGWKFGSGSNVKWVHFQTPAHNRHPTINYAGMTAQWVPYPYGSCIYDCVWSVPSSYRKSPGYWQFNTDPYGDKEYAYNTSTWPTAGHAPWHDFCEVGWGGEAVSCKPGQTSYNWVRAVATDQEMAAGVGLSRPVPYTNQSVYKDTGSAGISDPGVAGLTTLINNELTQHPGSYPVLIAWINHEADPDNPDHPDPTLPAAPHLTFTSTPAVVEEPGHADVVASWSSSGWSPYDVRISEGNDALTACSVQTLSSCTVKLGGWQHLHQAVDHTLRAEVVYDGKVLSTTTTTVTFQPHKWSLDLTPPADQVEVDPGVGSASVDLDASLAAADLDAPYDLRIVDADSGAQLTACALAASPCRTSVAGTGLAPHPIGHFRAEVVADGDDEPFATASADVYFHNPDYAVDHVKIDDVAGKFENALTLCISLNGFRLAPNSNGGTTNDYVEWCLDLEGKGWSVAAILAAAGALYGDDLINWLLHDGAIQSGEATDQVDAPNPLPQGYDGPVNDIQNKIRTRNLVDVIPDAEVPDVAKQCEWLASRAGNTSVSDCGDLPIFVVGRTANADVTEDIWRGVHRRAEWVKLTYLAIEKRIPWYTKYEQTDEPEGPKCVGSATSSNVDDWTACDEFPWQYTVEGGDQADPALRPYLRIIDYRENSGGGGEFNTFLDKCHVREAKAAPTPENGGGQFLVVPMPQGSPIPTRYVCNDVRGLAGP